MRFGNLDGRLVVLTGDLALDISAASDGRFGPAPDALFADWDDLLEWARHADLSAATVFDPGSLGAPVPHPRQVFAVALNYRPHVTEAGYQPPAAPLIFTKFPSCITGPNREVTLPPGNVDWELELVAVIGCTAVRVDAEHGWDVVAGVTVGQDLSERSLQLSGTPAQFSLGKSFPGFGPIGPALVTTDELTDPDDLQLSCTLSGMPVQQARTSEMIFSVPQLVAYISSVTPLLPGDLIFTGTPGGVGNRRVPPRFIGPGDVLVSEIEGLGQMRQTFSLR